MIVNRPESPYYVTDAVERINRLQVAYNSGLLTWHEFIEQLSWAADMAKLAFIEGRRVERKNL